MLTLRLTLPALRRLTRSPYIASPLPVSSPFLHLPCRRVALLTVYRALFLVKGTHQG